jgi:hypothetical protein
MTVDSFVSALNCSVEKCKLGGVRLKGLRLVKSFDCFVQRMIQVPNSEADNYEEKLSEALNGLKTLVESLDQARGPECTRIPKQFIWVDCGEQFWNKNFRSIKKSELAIVEEILWHFCCLIDVIAQSETQELYESENLKLYRDCMALQAALEKAISNSMQTV